MPSQNSQLRQWYRQLSTKGGAKRPLMQTHHGLLRWNAWDGRLWNIEKLGTWKNCGPVRALEIAEAKLEVARQRLSSHAPSRPLDNFFVNHTTAVVEAYRSVLPFIRIEKEMSVCDFLIRTSHWKIRNRLGPSLAKVMETSYAVSEEVGILMNVRLIKVHSPFNPLFFLAQIWRYKANAKRRSLLTAKRVQDKTIRQLAKAQGRFGIGSREVQLALRSPDALLKESSSLQFRLQRAWNKEPRCWAVEGLFESMHSVLAFSNTITKTLSVITKFGEMPTDSPLYRHQRARLQKSFRPLLDNIKGATHELSRLNYELAALRYYEIQHITLHDLSERVQRGKDLFRSIRKESEKNKIKRSAHSRHGPKTGRNHEHN
ncbi:hypothetical protein K505DRAFT_398663 [Melanomma pulvis-pyrius CBS 109.77]|uniref:Uncharacterized protein n=1 Tax=Melanomma pulvis-pyrius CBS 109.77 TaxID=1314802 RepID=A0A6A6WR47_9PLEO|nr:hypothetical protein K505DRAFT_398663 [Melanomma pulvis-pyrius CBS 109.77]